jgi:hypothetical protein
MLAPVPLLRRAAWASLQISSFLVAVFAIWSVVGGLLAISPTTYVQRFGKLPESLSKCEAITLPVKRGQVEHCSRPTSPAEFAGLSLCIVVSLWICNLAGKPGRGFQHPRRRPNSPNDHGHSFRREP